MLWDHGSTVDKLGVVRSRSVYVFRLVFDTLLFSGYKIFISDIDFQFRSCLFFSLRGVWPLKKVCCVLISALLWDFPPVTTPQSCQQFFHRYFLLFSDSSLVSYADCSTSTPSNPSHRRIDRFFPHHNSPILVYPTFYSPSRNFIFIVSETLLSVRLIPFLGGFLDTPPHTVEGIRDLFSCLFAVLLPLLYLFFALIHLLLAMEFAVDIKLISEPIAYL